MNDHVNFFHGGFVKVSTEQQISDHFKVFFSGDESSLSNDFVEVLRWLDVDCQRIKNKDQSFGVFEDGLLTSGSPALKVLQVIVVKVSNFVEVL